MKTNKPYHHFKGNDLSPSEKIQRKVIELLLNSKVSDSKRDSSIIFELKHSSEVIQVSRILAQKRNLDVRLAEVIAALHDISTIITGSYEMHGIKGAKIAEKILKETGGFSQKEIKILWGSRTTHSRAPEDPKSLFSVFNFS